MIDEKLFFLWAVFGAVAVLRWGFPNSPLTRAIFTWIGPLPSVDESWAHYQLRWAAFSFSWFLQITFVFTLLYSALLFRPRLYEEIWFQVLQFALAIGAGTAVLGTLGFLLRAAKARYIGPNPPFQVPDA